MYQWPLEYYELYFDFGKIVTTNMLGKIPVA